MDGCCHTGLVLTAGYSSASELLRSNKIPACGSVVSMVFSIVIPVTEFSTTKDTKRSGGRACGYSPIS